MTLRRLLALVFAFTISLHAAEARWHPNVLKQPKDWFRSQEARSVADSVLQYQSPQGGWPKSTDIAKPPRTPDDIPPPGRGRANSLDNEATTLPMEFLARMVDATDDARYRGAFSRGLDYLLAAQYPDGGWPQFFPLRGEYYDRITFNDDAMVRVMSLLQKIITGKTPYAFITAEQRSKSEAALTKAVACVLKTQIKHDGKLTAWCAQYDEQKLEPAWARSYEPPSLSGSESVGITRFLMSIEKPTPEVIAAIEAAVDWLRSAALQGIRLEDFTNAAGQPDKRVLTDPTSPALWARFYDQRDRNREAHRLRLLRQLARKTAGSRVSRLAFHPPASSPKQRTVKPSDTPSPGVVKKDEKNVTETAPAGISRY
jgi:PelA/Pel-15E family pectate lyase